MATWRNDRIYALSLLAGCGAILLLYVAACVVVDPYSVFGLFDFSRMNVERSFRYAKTRYIAEHCGEYRGILFGNSRSLQFSERDMEDDFEERYFNFSVQADSFAGIEEKLAWLMPRCGFKDVVLVVDAQMMLSRPLDQGLFLREHYYVTRTSKWEFYAPFLLVRRRSCSRRHSSSWRRRSNPPRSLTSPGSSAISRRGAASRRYSVPAMAGSGRSHGIPRQHGGFPPDYPQA